MQAQGLELDYAGYNDLIEVEPDLAELMLDEINTWDRIDPPFWNHGNTT